MQMQRMRVVATAAIALGAFAACVRPAAQKGVALPLPTGPITGGADVGAQAKANEPIVVTRTLSSTDPQMQSGKYFQTFNFTGSAGEQVTVEMTSAAFDTYLMLAVATPSGLQLVAQNDDGDGMGTNSRITATLPSASTYHIVATSFEANKTGEFTIRFVRGAPAMTQNPSQTQTTTSSAPIIPPAPAGTPDNRYALLVGINDYPGTNSDLNGPVQDAGIMRTVLIEKYGFRPENILMLTDAQATRDNIIRGFRTHLAQAPANGVAVFFYSGHGTRLQQNVAVQDTEEDNVDEALYIYGGGGLSSILVDDEIGILASELRTDRVLLAIDACHSGTGSRGTGEGPQSKEVRFRDIEMMSMPTTYLQAPASMGLNANRKDVLAEPDRHVLLAASLDREVSWTSGGWPRHGGIASVFTYILAEEMERVTPTTTLSELMTRVQAQTVTYTERRMRQRQTPQLEGTRGSMTVVEFLSRR